MCAARLARLKYNYNSDGGGNNNSNNNNNNNNDDDDTEQSYGVVFASVLGIELFSGASERAVGRAGSRLTARNSFSLKARERANTQLMKKSRDFN